jgi:nucleoid-associated protein YgaU
VLKDGVQIASSTVDRSGKFATIALIPPDGRGHSLTLSQLVGDAAQASEDEILLAPVTVPVTATVAEIASEPATDAGTNTAALTPSEALTPSDAVAPALAGDLASLSGPAPLVQDEVATVGAVPPLTGSSTPVAQTVASLAPDAATPQKPSAPAVLKSTAEGVELLNPETPEVMDNVALDTISYSNAGEVQLAGRAQSDATSVRVYLNNTARVDLPVDAAGRWRGDVPDVDEGIYTLRVDEVSADGKVSSRVETPFKREALEVLAAAAAAQDGPLKAITVQKGATLWAIARERYGEGELYVKVFEANKEAIRDPDLIYPGQIFALPQE